MKMCFDPITEFLNRSAWILWAVLWISLSLGVGQEEFVINPTVTYDTFMPSLISAVLLTACVLLQAVRQIYYGDEGPTLVKFGRWLILGATSIFAFRMVYTVVMYNGAPSSIATLIGVCILAVGLSLNAIGMMQQSYFKKQAIKKLKWNNRWRSI